jgi:hypothetical protein
VPERLEAQPAPVYLRQRLLLAGLLAVLSLALLAASVLLVTTFRARHDRAALRLLHGDNPDDRKRGAWIAADQAAPHAHALLAQRLREQYEPESGVREAYVYALGRSGNPEYFDVLAAVITGDDDAYVRQAAWIATARVAPDRFRDLAATTPPHDNAWDQVGLVAAWLEVGDTRGVAELLRYAVEGDPQQRRVAALALYRGVAPLLDAAGRWPIQANVREGEPWGPELVAEVRRRCGALDLQAMADDLRPHLAGAAGLRRNVARLTSLRDRLARFFEVNGRAGLQGGEGMAR